jgi:hypothetical protein
MLTSQDKQTLLEKGISEIELNEQIAHFHKGFPYLKIEAPASLKQGIMASDDNSIVQYMKTWDKYIETGKKVVKFVPASGAASRMFKNLFAFLDAEYTTPTSDFEKYFFDHLSSFAFYKELDNCCLSNDKKNIQELIKEGSYKKIVSNLLNPQGLNYGQLPKGLLKFHSYSEGARTPMEEHLVEGALYANVNGIVSVHFTVSHEHMELFKKTALEKVPYYEKKYGVKYEISFSEQKSNTDTLAVTLDNEPFRDDNGKMLFRPGGHGALIENLNDLQADIVFIKNIDNVVPDKFKQETVTYKKLLAGILVTTQQQINDYIDLLESGKYAHNQIEEIIRFVQQKLCCRKSDIKQLEDAELVIYLKHKLDRPLRVCGVVKNVGEPGGGPFLTYNSDGTISPQILESSQIDMSNPLYNKMFTEGTHFNPVDLVCAITDRKGNKYNLSQYVDKATGFISHKSKNGRELKALELPGLWNGAMSDWNTIFVEVPLATFNPVKTINDLLRPQHQN